jgi:transcriptional regulator with XRE-family HTH domain
MKINKVLGRFAELQLTQLEVAKKLGISRSTLSGRLKGKTNFSIREIQSLSKILGLSKSEMEDIFFD